MLLTLESLGFCAKGEGGAFVEAARSAARCRSTPTAAGCRPTTRARRGVFTVIEGVRQLRGASPGVQLDAPKTCLVNGTGGSLSATATMILGV